MAVEISLFRQASTPMMSRTALLMPPVDVQTATFTASVKGVIRIYVTTTAATITVGGKAITVPAGVIEYFGVQAGTLITVS